MGKIIVITGGTSGIGEQLKKLYEQNGDVVLTLSRRKINCPTHYSVDVCDELAVNSVFEDIKTKYGKIDVLINSAGFGMSGIFELQNIEEVKRLTDANYYGTIYCTRASLPLMSKGSKIINLSSAMALFPVPFRTIYGSVKSAILNLSFGLKMELAPLGIDVVAICPGDIKTNFTANRIKDFKTDEKYGNRLQSATKKSDDREPKRIPQTLCAKQIYNKISRNRCKPFYIIGKKYKFLYFLTRITPKSWLLKMTAKLYGGEL